MPSVRNLIKIPAELLQRVLLWTLLIDAQAEVALPLTCKFLKDQTVCAANNGAWKYAIEHYGNLATMMFAPALNQNLLHDWLPRLEEVMQRIEEAVELVQMDINVYTELSEPSSAANTPTTAIDVSRIMSTIKIGLYFCEAIHFWPQLRANNVRKLLEWSLPHKLLILRQLSSVIADLLGPRILHELGSSDTHQHNGQLEILRQNPTFMICAVEYELLLHGTDGIVDIVRPLPKYPSSDGHSSPIFIDEARPSLVDASSDSQFKPLQEYQKRRTARSKALGQILGIVGLLDMYQTFPNGPWQGKDKTQVISRNIVANYGDDEVPIFPTNRAEVLRLLAFVGTAVEGMSETEILTGIKATMDI